MLFNPNSMAFGRNETFFLKYNWTYKALHAVNQNKDFLSLPNSYLDLGVGKNMLSSIRYWLGAYQILDSNGEAFKDDIARAICYLIPDKFRGVLDVGTGKNYSVLELAMRMGKSDLPILEDTPNEPESLCADITQLTKLGWFPTIDIMDLLHG